WARGSCHRIRGRLLPAHALGGSPGRGVPVRVRLRRGPPSRRPSRRSGAGPMKRLIGVGVGPGDPELVTIKAVRVLRQSDVVLVPVLAGPDPEPGRAETIIRGYVDADKIKRLEFALNDTGGVTPRRAAAWRTAAAAVAREFAAGASTIAFGTLGDPNLYSTFSYLAQTVRDLVPGVDVQTMPGITAMQDLASRAGISLAEGTESVTLVPLNGGVSALDQALSSGGTVVGYKGGGPGSPAPRTLRARRAPPPPPPPRPSPPSPPSRPHLPHPPRSTPPVPPLPLTTFRIFRICRPLSFPYSAPAGARRWARSSPPGNWAGPSERAAKRSEPDTPPRAGVDHR